MKNKLNTLKRGCDTCFGDAKEMQLALKNRKPYNINFDEAKKIFSPLKDKIVRKIKKGE